LSISHIYIAPSQEAYYASNAFVRLCSAFSWERLMFASDSDVMKEVSFRFSIECWGLILRGNSACIAWCNETWHGTDSVC